MWWLRHPPCCSEEWMDGVSDGWLSLMSVTVLRTSPSLCHRVGPGCHPRAQLLTRHQFFTADLLGLRPTSCDDVQMDAVVQSHRTCKTQFLTPIKFFIPIFERNDTRLWPFLARTSILEWCLFIYLYFALHDEKFLVPYRYSPFTDVTIEDRDHETLPNRKIYLIHISLDSRTCIGIVWHTVGHIYILSKYGLTKQGLSGQREGKNK